MDCIRFEIGSRIKSTRKKNRISQEKLAEMSGLNTSYIGQIERGDKNPSIETVYRITKALNIELSALFENLTVAENINNQYPQAVYSMMLECDEEKCKKIYHIVSLMLTL